MRELHLPEGYTERDLELAEHVATRLRSKELVVCRLANAPTSVRPAGEQTFHPVVSFVAELAVGAAALWEAMIASLTEQNTAARRGGGTS